MSLPASADEISISQMSYIFNDGATVFNDTQWGAAEFSFTGVSGDVRYFNLWVDGVSNPWQVQNVPIQSLEGPGVDDLVTYYFDLQGLGAGDAVSGHYAFTTELQSSAPSGIVFNSVVGSDSWIMNAGLYGDIGPAQMPFELAFPGPKIGGEVMDPTQKHVNQGFPNQEAGKNECVPAAVSNSLQFLNAKKGLGLIDAQMSIATMKAATGWDEDGCPLDSWYSTKDQYMQTHNYGVTTRKITDISALVAEIDDNQDIELIQSWTDASGNKSAHAVAVVGIAKLADGRYSLTIVDDTKQGEAGGLSKREYIIDPATGAIDANGFAATLFEYAIVECPSPGSLSLLLLGGLVARHRRRA